MKPYICYGMKRKCGETDGVSPHLKQFMASALWVTLLVYYLTVPVGYRLAVAPNFPRTEIQLSNTLLQIISPLLLLPTRIITCRHTHVRIGAS